MYFGRVLFKLARVGTARHLAWAMTIAAVLFATVRSGQCLEPSALHIKQTSQLTGNIEMLLSKNGLRLTMPDRQLAIVMTAPKWEVCFLNIKRKIYSQSPAAKWTFPAITVASYVRPGDPSGLKSIRSETATLQGLSCRKHTMKVPPGTNSDGEHSWQKLLIKEGELYCLADPSYPRHVAAAVARTVGSIPVDGIPLQFICVSNRNQKEEELVLHSQNRTILKAPDLQIPAGYKKVPTPMEVLNSTDNSEGFADFIR